MTTQSKQFTGLIPVVAVTNFPRSMAYYTAKLGFAKKWDWGKPPDFGCVTRDGIEIFSSTAEQRPTGATLCNWVEDVDALHDDLTAELLIQHGADVNVHSGPIQGTPLHVAARRDNVAIGTLLLAAGADIEARDIKGETPLRRALNCRQPGMVELLVANGANFDAPDKRGVTPWQYAKKRGLRLPSREARWPHAQLSGD